MDGSIPHKIRHDSLLQVSPWGTAAWRCMALVGNAQDSTMYTRTAAVGPAFCVDYTYITPTADRSASLCDPRNMNMGVE